MTKIKVGGYPKPPFLSLKTLTMKRHKIKLPKFHNYRLYKDGISLFWFPYGGFQTKREAKKQAIKILGKSCRFERQPNGSIIAINNDSEQIIISEKDIIF